MAPTQPNYPDDLWPEGEVLRVDALSDKEVLTELQNIMNGCHYSWHTINQLLQQQLDNKVLEFTLEDGDVIFEWNNLCDQKQQWEKKGLLSISCADFNRDCLINLKIIPFKGGLDTEGTYLLSLYQMYLTRNKDGGS
jgi:hypothetical protein